jgi:hypothetical protein
MMKVLRTLLISLVWCAVSSAPAYVFKVDKWQKDNHTLYRFFDNHACQKQEDCVCDQQRNEFLYLAKKYHGLAVIEDIEYALPADHSQLCDPYAHICNQPLPWDEYMRQLRLYEEEKFLACLVTQCCYAQIPAINVEFRSSLSLALSESPDFLLYYKSYFTLVDAVKHAIQSNTIPGPSVDVIEKLVAQYNLNVVRAQALINYLLNAHTDVRNALQQRPWDYALQPLLDELDPHKFTQRGIPSAQRNHTFLISTLESPLVEARIIDAIVKNSHRTIFIAAGAAHHENLDPYLVQLGYTFKGAYGYTMDQLRAHQTAPVSLVDSIARVDSLKSR